MRSCEEVFPEEEYGLVGGMALGQLIAEADEQHGRTLDQGNAFTSIVTPPTWWPLIAGPVVYARELPAAWVGGRWPGDRRLRPQYMRLPMGSKHAALILIALCLFGSAEDVLTEWFPFKCFGVQVIVQHPLSSWHSRRYGGWACRCSACIVSRNANF